MKTIKIQKKQSGQSMIEFAFLLPIIVGMVVLLVQINSVINIAIVNQKYSRQHLMHLFFNSRYYPEQDFVASDSGKFLKYFYVGVQDKLTAEEEGGRFPRAPIQKIGRQKAPNDDESGDVETRQNVRVRVVSFTCSAPYGLKTGAPFSEGNLGDETFSSGNFKYCEE